MTRNALSEGVASIYSVELSTLEDVFRAKADKITIDGVQLDVDARAGTWATSSRGQHAYLTAMSPLLKEVSANGSFFSSMKSACQILLLGVGALDLLRLSETAKLLMRAHSIFGDRSEVVRACVMFLSGDPLVRCASNTIPRLRRFTVEWGALAFLAFADTLPAEWGALILSTHLTPSTSTSVIWAQHIERNCPLCW